MERCFQFWRLCAARKLSIDSGGYKPVEEAGAGIQVAAQDPEKLAAAVLALHGMPETERQKMGNAGRTLALEQYEYSQLARQFRDVLFPEDAE